MVTSAGTTPAISEIRPPHITRLRRSRPKLSVPNRYPGAPGGLRRSIGVIAYGSCGASHGAAAAAATTSVITTIAATTRGFVRRYARRTARAWPPLVVRGGAIAATPGRVTATLSSIAEAWVYECIGHIDQQIDHDVGQRD